MVQGQSYLRLYYNKACTRELEKDIDGNYIYKNTNITNNAVLPFTLKIWCKNDGSHTAYDISMTITSSDISATSTTTYLQILSKQIVPFPVVFNILKNDTKTYKISLKLKYDSI